ncbi:ribosomal protein L1p/L10e family-domain-containing protein [Cladochytrium replicatum]|nr:ribosomal protein L1p/L10e family-domain-containing protein [Cladochytrium replicatum]
MKRVAEKVAEKEKKTTVDGKKKEQAVKETKKAEVVKEKKVEVVKGKKVEAAGLVKETKKAEVLLKKKEEVRETAPVANGKEVSRTKSRVESAQLDLAVRALVAYLEKSKSDKSASPAKNSRKRSALDDDDEDGAVANGELLDPDTPIYLTFGTVRIFETWRTKPQRIPVKHSMLDDTADVCLFTKDPQKDYKKILEEKGVKGISKVIGVSKLRAKYNTFEARRQLLSQYTIFLADDAIVPMLGKLLGKSFFQKKRLPVAVDMKKIDLAGEIRGAISSTYLYPPKGADVAVKVANIPAHDPLQIHENVMSVLEPVVQKLGGWTNILNINIKTPLSVALPLYRHLPEADPLGGEEKSREKKNKKGGEKIGNGPEKKKRKTN